ncbi:MAG TPA: biotin--[acetyl-CoA-carboxylase] ligase [Bacteroidia bacterium]|nr:biotin--[acetyl-CoA-carboxylase] ligase [Bacteroidia bacterium]
METLFIGRNLIFLPEVPSTNSYAMNLLKNVNSPEGTVVYTAHQTQGKGQRGSSWRSEPARNLAMSVILKPNFLSMKNQFFLYQISALACYDTMSELLDSSQFDIKIKWPNDIIINQKKIAGILIENNILNNQINGCIVGIGVNINQQFFDRDLNATSTRLLTGKDFFIHDVMARLCLHLEKHYLALKNEKLVAIRDNYMQHFFGLNNWMDFEIDDVVKTLMVTSLSDRGLLLLKEKNGTLHEVDVKEIKWLY